MANRGEKKSPRNKENKKSVPDSQIKQATRYFRRQKKPLRKKKKPDQKQNNQNTRRPPSKRGAEVEDEESKERKSSPRRDEQEGKTGKTRNSPSRQDEEIKQRTSASPPRNEETKENTGERKNLTLLRPSAFPNSIELGGSNTNLVVETSKKANAGFIVAMFLPKFKAGYRLDGFTRQQAIHWIQNSGYRKNFVFGRFKRFGPLETKNYWKFTQRPVYEWVEELGIYRYSRLSPNSNILKLLFFYNKKQKNSVWTSLESEQAS